MSNQDHELLRKVATNDNIMDQLIEFAEAFRFPAEPYGGFCNYTVEVEGDNQVFVKNSSVEATVTFQVIGDFYYVEDMEVEVLGIRCSWDFVLRVTPYENFVTRHEGAMTPHVGVLTLHEGAATPHVGVLSPHEGAATPHVGVLSPHEGAATSHVSVLSPHEGAVTPHVVC